MVSDLQKKLIEKINNASNIIAQKSRTGSADFIIVSPEVAEMLKNLDPIIKLRKERKKKIEQIFKNL